MFPRIARSLFVVILSVGALGPMVLASEGLTDPQAAHFLSTAEQSDIAAANLVAKQTSNGPIRAFASDTLQNHASLKQRTAAVLGAANISSYDNEFSKSLAAAADQHQQELSKLSGAAFDKAYVENELFYYVAVIGALETKLIPVMKNSELKNVLEAGLAVFKERQKSLQLLSQNLRQPGTAR